VAFCSSTACVQRLSTGNILSNMRLLLLKAPRTNITSSVSYFKHACRPSEIRCLDVGLCRHSMLAIRRREPLLSRRLCRSIIARLYYFAAGERNQLQQRQKRNSCPGYRGMTWSLYCTAFDTIRPTSEPRAADNWRATA